MSTTRITAGAGTTSITHGHATFVPNADGVFAVPADIAAALVNQGSAAYAPDAAPVAPLAFNPAFNVSGGVNLANGVVRVRAFADA